MDGWNQHMIYEELANHEPLSQGDLIDDCPLLFWDVSPSEVEAQPTPATLSVRVVVLTQACDLAQSKATRVLVAVVHRALDLVNRGILKGTAIRDQIRSHRVYGWYFLPAGTFIDESLVDLRDLHTIPRVLLEQRIRQVTRLGRISTPYREHLAQHFSTTYSRIGLPQPYETEPEA
jgi:hypothetical protein